MSVIARNARIIINEKGLRHNYVAEKAGIDKKLFSALLTGRKIMREEHIVSIAKALDVTPNQLFEPSQAS